MAPFIDQDSTSSCADVSSDSPIHATDAGRCTDTFLYYSNDDIRIKTLKMDEDSEAIKKEGITKMVSIEQRKTRLSFELHPDVIMEKELLALSDDLPEDLADLVLGNDDSIGELLGEMDLLDEMLLLKMMYEPKSGRNQ